MISTTTWVGRAWEDVDSALFTMRLSFSGRAAPAAAASPMPVVGLVEELNELLEKWEDADGRRRIANRTNSVGAS